MVGAPSSGGCASRQLRFRSTADSASGVSAFPVGRQGRSVLHGQTCRGWTDHGERGALLHLLSGNAGKPGRIDPADFPALLADLLSEFGGEIGWCRDHMEEETIHFAPMAAHVMGAPWHNGRVILIGDAAHATTPHIGYGAGLAVEDGVVLAECLEAATTRDKALDTFMDRRFERCRMVVENGLRISRWQQGIDHQNADQAGLTNETWRALTAAE